MNCVQGYYNKSLNFLVSNYLFSPLITKLSKNFIIQGVNLNKLGTVKTHKTSCLICESYFSQLRQVCLLIITSKQLQMEIKGCYKQLLIFLQTVRANSVHIRSSHAQGVCNYRENDAQLQLQIFPKLGFSVQQRVHITHECMLYTEDYGIFLITNKSTCQPDSVDLILLHLACFPPCHPRLPSLGTVLVAHRSYRVHNLCPVDDTWPKCSSHPILPVCCQKCWKYTIHHTMIRYMYTFTMRSQWHKHKLIWYGTNFNSIQSILLTSIPNQAIPVMSTLSLTEDSRWPKSLNSKGRDNEKMAKKKYNHDDHSSRLD